MMFLVDTSTAVPHPKLYDRTLYSVVVQGARDSIDAGQRLIDALVNQGHSLIRRLAQDGANIEDVRVMASFVANTRLFHRPVAVGHRLSDAINVDFYVDGERDDETPAPRCYLAYGDEEFLVFYNSAVNVYFGDEFAFETIAYPILRFLDHDSSGAVIIARQGDRFGPNVDYCTIDVRLPNPTHVTFTPSFVETNWVDVDGVEVVIQNRNSRLSDNTLRARLSIPDDDILFIREFSTEWLDSHHPPTADPNEWISIISDGVFLSHRSPQENVFDNAFRLNVRRAVHRHAGHIDDVALWPVLASRETRLAAMGRIDVVWSVLPSIRENDSVRYMPQTTDVIRLALEMDGRGCTKLEPTIITDDRVTFRGVTKNGDVVEFVFPIDDGECTWQ